MEKFLRIGIVTKAHGIKGEVRVLPTTDDKKRFEKLKNVLLRIEDKDIPLTIASVKYSKQMVILKFAEFDNINQIEAFRGGSLMIQRDQAVELKQDEYFIPDLIDLKVITEENVLLGTLSEVIQTGANDVYVVKKEDGKEVLIPAIRQCIKSVDIEAGEMHIQLMEGLDT